LRLGSLRLGTLTAGWVFVAGRDIGVAVFLPLLLLYQIDVCQHHSLFILIGKIDRRCPCPALLRFLDNAPSPICPACTSFRNRNTSLRCICNYLPYVLSSSHARASEFLPGAGGECASLLGGGASASLRFVKGKASIAAAEFVACGEEAFAGVAFAEEGLVLGAELVPEGVEWFIVRAVDDVA